MDALRLASGGHAVVIDPHVGGRLVSWTAFGEQLLIESAPDPVEYGMYAMAPWAGRLRGNCIRVGAGDIEMPATYQGWALHGTVLGARASSVATESSAAGEVAMLAFDEHPGLPVPMSVTISYELTATALTTVIAIDVHAGDGLPVVVGWHPWFRRHLGRGGPCEWSMPAAGRVERGADYLPTGQITPADPSAGPFDDAFWVPEGRASVHWPGVGAIEVTGDATWFVVYDMPEASVCLEPQSGPPNGVNDPLVGDRVIVRPGEPWRWTTRWQLRDDRPGDRAG